MPNELEALQARIAELEAQNKRQAERLAVKQKITMKVSEKGAVSFYGLGRFPFTFYIGQLERFLAHFGQSIDGLAADNDNALQVMEWRDDGKLATKD